MRFLLVTAFGAAVAAGLLLKACGYDLGAVAIYAAYMLYAVLLPGGLLLYLAQRRSLSWTELLALGLPVGFGIEILTFFALSALRLRELLPYVPVLWFAGAGLALRCAAPSARIVAPSLPALAAFALLAAAFVVTVVSRFYASAPMLAGVLDGSTHHDWVYLLSRAAEIKAHWPLEDPSMAGAPLSYHYFLLVHLASASLVTQLNLELLSLRFFPLPLGAALLAQAYWLGRAVTRVPAGGFLAAVLLLAAGEVSFRYDAMVFGQWFLDWLFISPTFFFGMIYTGALLVWIHRMVEEKAPSAISWFVLALLGAIGTGAKGTVVPPLLLALACGAAARIWATKRLPIRVMHIGAVLGIAFAVVYFIALRAWGTGSAILDPFASARVALFWNDLTAAWTSRLVSLGVPGAAAGAAAKLACFLVVLGGGFGVQLLAVWGFLKARAHGCGVLLVAWLGLVAVAHALFGQLLYLDSNSQLYLWLPIALPLAVVASSALVHLSCRVIATQRDPDHAASAYARWLLVGGVVIISVILVANKGIGMATGLGLGLFALFVLGPTHRPAERLTCITAFRTAARVGPMIVVAAILAVQLNQWRLRNLQGFGHWLAGAGRSGVAELQLVREGMQWVRDNTPADALLVSNAFTRRTLQSDNLAVIDNTTVDRYYYYSAFAERRFWVEGPSYLRDQEGAARRIESASRFFYDHELPTELLQCGKPLFAIVDRAVRDGASVPLSREARVFSNSRLEIYRWSAEAELPWAAQTAATVPKAECFPNPSLASVEDPGK